MYNVGQIVWVEPAKTYVMYVGPAKIKRVFTGEELKAAGRQFPYICFIPHESFSKGKLGYPIQEREIQYVVFDNE